MDVLMPQLGETVSEGKIVKWFKSAGDQVKPGDNLFEIETDKVSMEVPSTTTGVLAEIRVASGAVAPVGAVVAVISDAAGAAAASAAAASPRSVVVAPSPQAPAAPARAAVAPISAPPAPAGPIKLDHRWRRNATDRHRRIERRAALVRRERARTVEEPYVIFAVDEDRGDLAEDPVIGKRLRPVRIHLEARRRRRGLG